MHAFLACQCGAARRLTHAQMEADQDHARQVLQFIGIDPAPFFTADESWVDDYE